MLLFIVSLILLIAPNTALFLTNSRYEDTLLCSLVIILLVLLSIKPKRYYLLLPLIWLMPVACFYMFNYSRPLDTMVFSIIYDTNLEESESYFGNRFYIYIGAYILYVIGTTFIYLPKRISNIEYLPFKRLYIAATTLTIFFVYMVFNIYNSGTAFGFYNRDTDNIQTKIIDSYPVTLAYNANEFISEIEKLKESRDELENFTFNTKQEVNQPDLVVLVIGETSRGDRWSMNGYSRDTTPLLSKQKNLLNYKDSLSLANATILSVPMMLTRKQDTDVLELNFKEQSIIKAFKEVGYSTYWLSTQQKISSIDSLTSFYASEADQVSFYNFSNGSADRDRDGILVDNLKKLLKKDGVKKFIVLHTLGSHHLYDKRYPLSFNKFKPSLTDLDSFDPRNKKYKKEINNSYDNSILYTDYILNEIINTVNNEQKKSLVLYSSDHGEDIFDGDCTLTSHGNRSIYNFKVPFFVWYSDQYSLNNPDKIATLKSNLNKPINHSSIFPTLLKLSNMSVKNMDDSRSLTNTNLGYKRLIMGDTDFDSTKPSGICNLVD